MKKENRVRRNSAAAKKSTQPLKQGDNASFAQSNKPAEKSGSKVPKRARADRGYLKLQIGTALFDGVKEKAQARKEGPYEFMVNAIRERTIFGSVLDLKDEIAALKKAREENQVERGSKQWTKELKAAKRLTAEFYSKWRWEKYGCAVYKLADLSCAIQHHPELQTICQAMQDVASAEYELDCFACEGKAATASGHLNAHSDEERAARFWFEDFYKRVHAMTFLGAQLEFGGLHPWIKGQAEYPQPASALAQSLAGMDVLEKFLENFINTEGLETTTEKQGVAL